MATLTAAGVNCSDGSLNGMYTGTAVNYTSYPVGSYLGFLYNTGGPNLNINGTFPAIYSPPTSGTAYFINVSQGAGSGVVAGTWRMRAYFNYSSGCGINQWSNLAQRVA